MNYLRKIRTQITWAQGFHNLQKTYSQPQFKKKGYTDKQIAQLHLQESTYASLDLW
jgi:hypothetical protein